jgi:amino acid adenylation domain-containing protein
VTGLLERVDEVIRQAADSTAVVAGSTSLSFTHLDALSRNVAAGLRRRGVGPGDRVGLRLGRTAELVVAILGVWRTGAAYLPIDRKDPPARVRAMLADAPVRLTLDDVSGDLTGISPDPAVAATCGPVAYTMFTSGTTGRPVAVDIPHTAVARLRSALDGFLPSAFPGVGIHRVALNAPITFDSSVKQLVQLASGRELHILDDRTRLSATALSSYVSEHDIHLLDITPSHLRLLLAADPTLAALAGTCLMIGGEAIDQALAGALRSSSVRGYAGVYGPTECCVDATAATASQLPGLGTPLPGVDVWIRGDNGEILGTSAPGEIVIGGWGVASGYLGEPGTAAASRFVPRPDGADGLAFRTGDIGIRHPGGTFAFLGRRDEQLKIGGRRFDPLEVTTVLSGAPGIAAAAVVPDRSGLSLTAFVVPTGTATDAVGQAERRAAEWLPHYLRPHRTIALDQLPLTTRGKLDQAELARLADHHDTTGTRDPADGLDALALAQVRNVLGDDTVGPDDDFFEAGGDSATAVRLVRGLTRRTGRPIALLSFLTEPTARHLARLLDDAAMGAEATAGG